jgi:transcriptional regulator with XRE-family HTH domain
MPIKVVTFGGEEINLSQISRDTGISVSHLSRIFSGKRDPSVPNAKKISQVLDVSLDCLIEGLPKKL